MLSCLGTATDLLDVPKQPTCMNASHCPEREIIGHVTFPTPTHVSFLCARERSRSSLRFFSSVSRAVSRLNRLLVVSSAAQCVNVCALPGGVAGDENGTRTRVAYVHRRGRRHVRTGERTCFVEKSHLMCALALVLFLLARAPRRGQCMGLHAGKLPCKHRSAKQHRFAAFFHSSFVGKSRARWLPARAQEGLQLLVQFPVSTVHACRLRRNVQQVHIQGE